MASTEVPGFAMSFLSKDCTSDEAGAVERGTEWGIECEVLELDDWRTDCAEDFSDICKEL